MSVSAPLPPPPARAAPAPEAPRQRVTARVKLIDRIADLFIRAGGLGIIIIVALIFVFIGAETVPLFRGAKQQVRYTAPLPGGATAAQVLALGVDEYESHAYYVDAAAGAVRFFDVAARKLDAEFPLRGLGDARATAAYRTPARDKLFIGTSDGALLIAEANFAITYDSQTARTVKPGFEELARIEPPVEDAAITRVHGRQNSSGDFFYAAATADGRVFTGKFIEDEPADDPMPVGGEFEGAITALIIDYEGNRLFVATDVRKLYQYYLDDNRDEPFKVYDLEANITALDFAIGDVALLIGFDSGAVESWFGVRESETDVFKPVRRIHAFEIRGRRG
jgi:phosphate transport system permease protein